MRKNHAFERGKVLTSVRHFGGASLSKSIRTMDRVSVGGGGRGWGPGLGGLEGSRRPQHLGLAPPGARDQEPDREAVPGEPARHRDRGHAPRR